MGVAVVPAAVTAPGRPRPHLPGHRRPSKLPTPARQTAKKPLDAARKMRADRAWGQIGGAA